MALKTIRDPTSFFRPSAQTLLDLRSPIKDLNINSRPNRPKPNVRVHHLGAAIVSLHLGRHARILSAVSTGGTGLALLLGRVDGVEPEHVGVVIVPDGHDQDHGHAQGRVELVEAAHLGEAVAVVEGLELRAAELGRDGGGVRRDTLDVGSGDLNLLAVLDEELGELVLLEAGDDAVGMSVLMVGLCEEKGDAVWKTGNIRELLAGIDGLALAVEVGVAHAVRVVVATVGVAKTGEAVLGVGTAAGIPLADVVLVVLARVRREGERVCVGLPVCST